MADQEHKPLAENVTGENAIVAGQIGTVNVYAKAHAPAKPTILSNLPPVSPTFIPRQNITREIHTALNAPGHTSALRQAAARAYGGFGKTVAAILYGHEYANDYPGGRFFLSMEAADPLTALASLGRFFNVPDEAKPEAAAAMVKAGLEGAPGADGVQPASLLILDNIVDVAHWEALTKLRIPGTNEPLLPRGGCRLLITTRAESIPQATTIRIGRLTNEEAREVYRRFCALADVRGGGGRDAPSDEVADAITTLVGGLAVAVAAVAARMKLRPEITWADYAEKLATLDVNALPDASEEVRREIGTSGEALAEHRRTLRIIDDCLDSLPPPERRALEYAALLPADMAPKPWLIALLEADAARPATNSNGTPDPLALTPTQAPDLPGSAAGRVIQHLDTLDLLLEAGEGGKLLSLHRLWHARVNQKAEADKLDRTPLLLAIADCAKSRRATIIGRHPDGADRGVNNPAAVTDQSLRWELNPLAEVCKGLWRAGYPGETAGVGLWLVAPLRALGRFAEAAACLPLSDSTDAVFEAAIGCANLASAYSNLALIQQDEGDLPGARASIEKAIAIDSKHLAPDHPTFATRYSNLAMIQRDQGDLPKARASMEKAIEIVGQHSGPEHSNLAVMHSNLAGIQQDQGDLPGARASIEKAIAIQSKHFAPDHPTFATRFSNLAMIQLDQGDLPGARASMERSIAIDQEHFAPDHPTFAISYSNLAAIQQAQGDGPGARLSLGRAIAIQQKHFAPGHPAFATSYNNFAMILQDLGDLEQALQYKQLSMEVERKHLGEQHPQMGGSYHNLAHICFARGDRGAARANWKKALAILLVHFDENHPHVKAVRASMAAAGCGG